MKEKLKAILDNRGFWALIGTVAGSALSPEVRGVVDAVGLLVMAVI